MLHLAVALLPRDFGGVEDCLFRCSSIDNLITLCQVKPNCPQQWKSQESHLCQGGGAGARHSAERAESFSPASSSCLPLPERSISSWLKWNLEHFIESQFLNRSVIYIFYFFPPFSSHIFQFLHCNQSSRRNKRGKSETGSPLKYYSCIISSRLNLRVNKLQKQTANIQGRLFNRVQNDLPQQKKLWFDSYFKETHYEANKDEETHRDWPEQRKWLGPGWNRWQRRASEN